MLSNLSGNVSKQIVNQNKGTMEGLYYINKKEDQEEKIKLMKQEKKVDQK